MYIPRPEEARHVWIPRLLDILKLDGFSPNHHDYIV